jgi:hypothetical protein
MKVKKDSADFASDAQRLAAIRKTAEELAEPPGTDIKILVGEALDAYWAARENSVEASEKNVGVEFSFVNETATLARAAARNMINPKREFFSDLISTLVPMAITLLLMASGYYLMVLRGSNIFPMRRLPYLIAVIPLFLGIIGIYVLFRYGDRLKRWGILRHSMGAIAGGAIIAGLLLGYSARQRIGRMNISKDLNTTSTALAQDQLEELVLSSIEQKHTEGHFLKTSTLQGTSIANNEKILELSTTSYAEQQVVYEADTKGLHGHLVADIQTNGGDLYLQDEESRELRSQFIFGKVVEANDDNFSIKTNGDPPKFIKLSRGPFIQKPIIGTYIAVAVDPNTLMALKSVTVSDRIAQDIRKMDGDP